MSTKNCVAALKFSAFFIPIADFKLIIPFGVFHRIFTLYMLKSKITKLKSAGGMKNVENLLWRY